MDCADPDWQAVAIFGRVNQYYFTGTMQDGLLWIPRDGEAVLWVRKSFERAVDESLFGRIETMNSFRDVVAYADSHKVNNRIAAYMLALDRVAFAIKLRGIYA